MEDQPSRASVSELPFDNTGVEEFSELDGPFQTQSLRPSISEWFGMFNQVVAAAIASGSSSQYKSLEAAEIVEKAKRFRA